MKVNTLKLTRKLDSKLIYENNLSKKFLLNFQDRLLKKNKQPLIGKYNLKKKKLTLIFDNKKLKKIIKFNDGIKFLKIIVTFLLSLIGIQFFNISILNSNFITLILIILTIIFFFYKYTNYSKKLNKLKKTNKLKKEIIKNLDGFYTQNIFKYNIKINEDNLYIYISNKKFKFNTIFDLPSFFEKLNDIQDTKYIKFSKNFKKLNNYWKEIYYFKTNIETVFYSDKYVYIKKSIKPLNKIIIIKTTDKEIETLEELLLKNEKIENEYIIELKIDRNF